MSQLRASGFVGHHFLSHLLGSISRLGAGAPPNMTVTHYPDLLGSHNIVLARADVVSPHVVSAPEVRLSVTVVSQHMRDPCAHACLHGVASAHAVRAAAVTAQRESHNRNTWMPWAHWDQPAWWFSVVSTRLRH